MNGTRTPRPRTASGNPWLLPEDGIVDEIAVELTVKGTRRVPLTPGERLAVAALILASGGTRYRIAKRLHISGSTARRLADAITTTTDDLGAAA